MAKKKNGKVWRQETAAFVVTMLVFVLFFHSGSSLILGEVLPGQAGAKTALQQAEEEESVQTFYLGQEDITYSERTQAKRVAEVPENIIFSDSR